MPPQTPQNINPQPAPQPVPQPASQPAPNQQFQQPAAPSYSFANQPPVADDSDKLEDLQKQIEELQETQTQLQEANQEPAAETRPTNWSEFEEYMENKIDSKLSEQEKAQLERTQESDKLQDEVDKYIDDSLNNLRQAGQLPPVANPADPNDQGVAAQKELVGYANYLGTANLNAVATELNQRHQRGERFDWQSNTWTGGEQKTDSFDFTANEQTTNNTMFNPTPPQPTPAPTPPIAPQPYPPAGYPPQPLPGAYAPVGSSSGVANVPGGAPSYQTISQAQDLDSLVQQWRAQQT